MPKPIFPQTKSKPATKLKTRNESMFVPERALARPFPGILDGEPMPTMDERRRRKDYYQQ